MAVKDAFALAKQVLRSGAVQVVGSLGVLVASGVTGSIHVVLGYAGADPLAFAMWSALAFLLGAFVWQTVDEARMRPSKRRRLLRMRLSGLSSREIATLARVFRFGAPIPLSVTDPCVQALNAHGFLRMVPNSDMCGRDSYFFVMDDSLHALMSEFPDTFEDVEWEKGKQVKPFC